MRIYIDNKMINTELIIVIKKLTRYMYVTKTQKLYMI